MIISVSKPVAQPASPLTFSFSARSIRKNDHILENRREGFGQEEELARAVLEGHYVGIGCCIDGAAGVEKELAVILMRMSS